MPYVLLIILAFFGFVWLGRASKAGKIKPGSWVKQGRAISAIVGILCVIIAINAMMRGLWLLSAFFLLLSAFILGGLRFNWRLRDVAGSSGFKFQDKKMQDALSTLGLGDDANEEAVMVAWREKMKSAHPDHGGSTHAASKLNAARDYALKKFSKPK